MYLLIAIILIALCSGCGKFPERKDPPGHVSVPAVLDQSSPAWGISPFNANSPAYW